MKRERFIDGKWRWVDMTNAEDAALTAQFLDRVREQNRLNSIRCAARSDKGYPSLHIDHTVEDCGPAGYRQMTPTEVAKRNTAHRHNLPNK